MTNMVECNLKNEEFVVKNKNTYNYPTFSLIELSSHTKNQNPVNLDGSMQDYNLGKS